MGAFIIRRLIMAVIVLLFVSIMIFFTMRLLPGDPILLVLTQSQQNAYSEEDIEAIRHQYGLDKSLFVQYLDWVGQLFHGDLGKSILERNPVANEIGRRIPITLYIGLLAFVIGFIIGIPVGIICAVRRGTWIDTMLTTLANLGITVPSFWLGLMLVYVFSLTLKWLPTQGFTSPFTDLWQSIRQIIMPVICLSLFPVASTARQTRSSMLEVMRQDYIRTAWAKGLKERVIIITHGLKNGLIPIITLSGAGLSMIIGGSVIVEQVFNIPGMGRLAVTSIMSQDYPYVQGIVLVVATSVMMINLLVDLAYGWLDPRIRYS